MHLIPLFNSIWLLNRLLSVLDTTVNDDSEHKGECESHSQRRQNKSPASNASADADIWKIGRGNISVDHYSKLTRFTFVHSHWFMLNCKYWEIWRRSVSVGEVDTGSKSHAQRPVQSFMGVYLFYECLLKMYLHVRFEDAALILWFLRWSAQWQGEGKHPWEVCAVSGQSRETQGILEKQGQTGQETSEGNTEQWQVCV